MGIEFCASPISEPSLERGRVAELPVSSLLAERVRIRSEAETTQACARRADAKWVSGMDIIGTVFAGIDDGKPAILSLSDGITSHAVMAVGYRKGPEEYLVLYQDPSRHGSFLEAGKNVAGCAAELQDRPGLWAIRASQLCEVLDTAIMADRKQQDDPRD
jgi:hypothetical protein